MHSLGEGVQRPPLEKALENRYRVEIHVHSTILEGQIIEKKYLSKFDAHDSTSIFQGLFKNIVIRSVN